MKVQKYLKVKMALSLEKNDKIKNTQANLWPYFRLIFGWTKIYRNVQFGEKTENGE